MNVEVRRSARRRRTVQAYERDGTLVVLVPDSLSAAEEAAWVARMQEKVRARSAGAGGRSIASDDDLLRRARRLSREHLDGRADPRSVRWVTNQQTRWGSCTPARGTIRLSHRLQSMPGYVVDSVLVHELAHLLVPGHTGEFWRWADRFPQAERAKGYLEGVAAAAGLDLAVCDQPDEG